MKCQTFFSTKILCIENKVIIGLFVINGNLTIINVQINLIEKLKWFGQLRKIIPFDTLLSIRFCSLNFQISLPKVSSAMIVTKHFLAFFIITLAWLALTLLGAKHVSKKGITNHMNHIPFSREANCFRWPLQNFPSNLFQLYSGFSSILPLTRSNF